MPPLASANLPMCFSVAPVKEPFSWPNRINSTSVSGRAPQLTVTNDFPRRSELPWIARAISSLPTPDSPSMRIGMFDFAARSASRTVRAIEFGPAHDVAKAEFAGVAPRRSAQLVLERVDPEGVLDRHLKPLGPDRLDDEIRRARAHRRNDRLDRAVRGLNDRGDRDVALAHAREHPHAVEIGHHQIENEQADRRPVGRLQAGERRFTRFERLDVVAESPRHRLQQAALDGIVVDNEDEGGHGNPAGAAWVRPRVAPTV